MHRVVVMIMHMNLATNLEIFIPPKFGFVDFWASTNDVVRGLLVILRLTKSLQIWPRKNPSLNIKDAQ